MEDRKLQEPKKRTLLFVLPKTTEFGGLEKHLSDLLQALQDPQLSLSVLCFERDVFSERLDPQIRARVAVNCKQEPRSLWDWIRVIRESHPDTVIFCYSWIEAFAWQAPVAAMLAGVKNRFCIQHLIPSPALPLIEGRSPLNTLRRFAGKRARRIFKAGIAARVSHKTVCVSEAVRRALVNDYKFPAGKTITMLNGVPTARFAPSEKQGVALRARLGINPDEFLLVCAARLAEAKGLDILLQAVSRVRKKGIRCKCVILGAGPLKDKLLQQNESLGLSGSVFFEGYHEDIRPYLQSASAFILTSYLEGLPLSVLEAMACGLPCIVTNVGGSAEAVLDHVVGLVIPPGSVDAAEDAISYLSTHPEERARMGSLARKRACQEFDIEDRMNRLREVVLS